MRYLFILLAVLCGCSRNPVTPEDAMMAINYYTIEGIMASNGIPKDAFTHGRVKWLCPSPDWLTNSFLPKWEAEKASKGIQNGTAAFVCQDFSRACTAYASELGVKCDEALALFEFWYSPDKAVNAHSVVVALVRDPKLRLLFVEPQSPSRVVELSRSEMESCWLMR